MYGPPSSPPQSISPQREDQLRSALLPAFGHDNSSPNAFKPRQFLKPKYEVHKSVNTDVSGFLPTPIPTSEANMQASSPLQSSPQQMPSIQHFGTLGKLDPENRGSSNEPHEISRAVSVVRVPANGDAVTVGRSSKSSTFALTSSNRLISRVHASLSFDVSQNLLKIECLGWNGMKVTIKNWNHGGMMKSYEVSKGQVLNIERADGVSLDIHGDKAMVELIPDTYTSDVTEDETWLIPSSLRISGSERECDFETKLCSSPQMEPMAEDIVDITAEKEHRLREMTNWNADLEGKPVEDEDMKNKSAKDEVKDTGVNEVETFKQSAMAEDEDSNVKDAQWPSDEGLAFNSSEDVEKPLKVIRTDKADSVIEETETSKPLDATPVMVTEQNPTNQENVTAKPATQAPKRDHSSMATEFAIDLSRANSNASRVSSEESEASATRKHRRHWEPMSDETREQLTNVIVNHIAFSRSSLVPLNSVRKASSAIQALPKSQIIALIREIDSVGIIEGAVEDLTARKADDDYYYLPEKDTNEARRQAAQGTRGHRSLRNCRKTSKQYYYRPLQLE